MAESDKWVDRPWLLLVRRKIVVVGIQQGGAEAWWPVKAPQIGVMGAGKPDRSS